ncbi:MAG TPA: chemotaxis protein CheW [Candidatus Dormibacteraeota bacterium]|nr:chemotaxis protein CheW [Candidatus Dormibacteraeota bacterium]
MTTVIASLPTNALPEIVPQSVVLLRLGERRFAIAASQISELVAPSRLFKFPHQSAKVEGVILRRGRIVPVCEVAERLLGKKLSARRFYLIAVRDYGAQSEWVAIPVTGECELINAEITDASPTDAPHIAGWISHDGNVIEVLDVSALTNRPEEVPFTARRLANLATQPEATL